MKPIRSILFLSIITCLLSSCLGSKLKTVGVDSVKEVTSTVDSLTQEEVVENLTKNAVEGALQGLGSEASEDEISKLSAALSASIGKELDKIFKNLDTRTPGSKFSKGVTENLLSKEVEKQVTDMLSKAINTADGDITIALKSIEGNLNESLNEVFENLNHNIRGLETVLMNTMSEKLRDSLSYFLTDALNGIQFDSVSSNISTDLLSDQLRDTLSQIVVDIQKEISEGENSIFDAIKNIVILVFLLSLAWVWYFFNRKRKESESYEKDLEDSIESILSENDGLKEKLLKELDQRGSLKTFNQKTSKKNLDSKKS